ncbi:hypothetical protein V6N13_113692 [Hibiscus sabdariffa]
MGMGIFGWIDVKDDESEGSEQLGKGRPFSMLSRLQSYGNRDFFVVGLTLRTTKTKSVDNKCSFDLFVKNSSLDCL